MRCLRCRSAQMVEIRLSIGGSDVTLHACPSCEVRWWDREGERLGLDNVLALASNRA